VPKINLITGKAYGSGYIVMNSKHVGADLVFAVDSAKIGTMEATAAAEIIYGEKSAELSQKAAEYEAASGSAAGAAARGYVDAVIPGTSVRRQLIYAFEMLKSKADERLAHENNIL
jgi:acetyl-CoA carboxylase carboxyltransferase component